MIELDHFYEVMKHALRSFNISFHEKEKVAFEIKGDYAIFHIKETGEEFKIKMNAYEGPLLSKLS